MLNPQARVYQAIVVNTISNLPWIPVWYQRTQITVHISPQMEYIIPGPWGNQTITVGFFLGI